MSLIKAFNKETFKKVVLPSAIASFALLGVLSVGAGLSGKVAYVSDIPDCDQQQQVSATIKSQDYIVSCK